MTTQYVVRDHETKTERTVIEARELLEQNEFDEAIEKLCRYADSGIGNQKTEELFFEALDEHIFDRFEALRRVRV